MKRKRVFTIRGAGQYKDPEPTYCIICNDKIVTGDSYYRAIGVGPICLTCCVLSSDQSIFNPQHYIAETDKDII